jgi:uncharacterized UPF0160 family protein
MDKKKVTVVTHSSGFHTDDVFAVATLFLLLEKDHEITVIRSREKDVIDKADYVVDTGNTYEPEKNRFDHHQEGKAGERKNGIPYASFGLVWKKFGEQLAGSVKASEEIDRMLVQPIDAPDNGVQFLESKIPNIRPFDIGTLSFIFAPTWKEKENIDDVFMGLVLYAKVIIARAITSVKDAVEAEQLVIKCYNSAEDKRLIVIDERYPWNDTLSKFKEPLFVVYKNQQGNWSIKGIRDDSFSFIYRKYLPKSWAGKRDADLERVTGVSGAIFCHNHIFMAVAKTKEAILKMAEIALNS